jgi:hypothetical protein
MAVESHKQFESSLVASNQKLQAKIDALEAHIRKLDPEGKFEIRYDVVPGADAEAQGLGLIGTKGKLIGPSASAQRLISGAEREEGRELSSGMRRLVVSAFWIIPESVRLIDIECSCMEEIRFTYTANGPRSAKLVLPDLRCYISNSDLLLRIPLQVRVWYRTTEKPSSKFMIFELRYMPRLMLGGDIWLKALYALGRNIRGTLAAFFI